MPPRALFAFIVGAIFSFGFIGIGAYDLYRDWQFSGDVQRVSGVIDQTDFGGGRNNSNSVSYHYDVGTVVMCAIRQSVGQRVWRKMRVGQPIPVKYLAGAPSASRIDLPIEDEWYWHNAIGQMIAGAVFFGVVFVSTRYSQPRRFISIGEAGDRLRDGWENR
jgi:hypothetical protein